MKKKALAALALLAGFGAAAAGKKKSGGGNIKQTGKLKAGAPFTIEVGQGTNNHTHVWDDTGTNLHEASADFTPEWLAENEWDGVLGWTSNIKWGEELLPPGAKPGTAASMHQILLTQREVKELRDTGEVIFETAPARVSYLEGNMGKVLRHEHTHPVRIRAQREKK